MGTAEGDNHHLPFSVGRALLCTVLGLSFALGIPGNILVIWTICNRMKQRPLTIVLILHLAIADFLVLLTLPIWIYSVANTWPFGNPACKALTFVVYCSMYASIFLITALSLERFMVVFYPFLALRWKNKMAATLVFLVWFFAILFGATIIPFRVTHDTDAGLQCAAYSYASGLQEVAFLLLETLVGFTIPFTIISICYACVSRRIRKMTSPTKKRSARLIASVVTAFGLCWFPHHLFNLIEVLSVLTKDWYPEISEASAKISSAGVYVAGSVAFISSCINPLLYAFAARNFQSSMKLAKLSKLFEQISPSERQESPQEAPGTNGQKETVSSLEMV